MSSLGQLVHSLQERISEDYELANELSNKQCDKQLVRTPLTSILRLVRHLNLHRQHDAVLGATSSGHTHRIASQRYQSRLEIQLIGSSTGHSPY